MPGGFVPYHHSTGKKYKNPGYTSGGSKSGGTGTGSATYGSPSNPYVPSGSSSSTSYSGSSSSSSSSSAAAAKAVAQAQAAVKAAKAVVSEYGKDKKNPKSVSGKYAKASEKAKKNRERSQAKVQRKTAEVKRRYEGPQNTENLRPRLRANPSIYEQPVRRPGKPAAGRQRPSTALSAPKPRKVAKRLQKAVKRAQPKGMVPEVVPPNMRGAVAKYGKMLNPALKEAGVDMRGPEYLGKLIQFESGWDKTAENPSSAYGYGQFIDSTAEDFRDRLGVETQDPSKPRQMIKGAAMHASGKFGYSPLYAGYNPGYSDTDPIPSVDSGNLVPTGGKSKPIPKPLKRTARQTLGKKPTKAILRGGKVVKDPDAESQGPVEVSSAREQVKAGAIQKPSAKEDKYFSYDHETDRAWFDPVLQKQLIALAKTSGEPIQLNSGFRTLAEQKAAYADYQSGGALAATPGSSNHEFGLAADLQLTDKQRSMLGEFGLGLPVPGEDWHVEVVDPKLQAQQSAVNLGTAGGSATVTGESPNIAIKGTNLAVKLPTPAVTGGTTTTGGTTFTGGTSSTGAPLSPAEAAQQAAEKWRKRTPSVAKRLAAIDRWMTSPVTAPTPEISQELIDRILGK